MGCSLALSGIVHSPAGSLPATSAPVRRKVMFQTVPQYEHVVHHCKGSRPPAQRVYHASLTASLTSLLVLWTLSDFALVSSWPKSSISAILLCFPALVSLPGSGAGACREGSWGTSASFSLSPHSDKSEPAEQHSGSSHLDRSLASLQLSSGRSPAWPATVLGQFSLMSEAQPIVALRRTTVSRTHNMIAAGSTMRIHLWARPAGAQAPRQMGRSHSARAVQTGG